MIDFRLDEKISKNWGWESLNNLAIFLTKNGQNMAKKVTKNMAKNMTEKMTKNMAKKYCQKYDQKIWPKYDHKNG